MRSLLAGIVLCAGVCLAADGAPTTAPSACSDAAGAPACQAAAKDLKAARQAFSRGLKLQHTKKLDEAFAEFEEAAHLIPQNVEYLTAREMVRQQLVGFHLDRGNNNLRDGRQIEALAEFRQASQLDPQNEFAQQRLRDAAGPVAVRTAGTPLLVASVDAIASKPKEEHHDFHYRGDSRGLLTAIATSYGLTIIFDDAFPNRRVRFDIEDVNFATAIQTAEAVTKSFSVPLDEKVLFATLDSPENHRLYDRMGLRSFYIPGGPAPQELNELLNSVRSLFELRFATLHTASSTITVRGPQGTLDAATKFLETLDSTRPEVLLDIKVYEVDHSYARSIGLHIPNDFRLFNIPVAALAALGGQNIQDLINQLISSGGINQAGNESIQALLAQLQSQQNSIFSQPVATFGGGITLMGLTFDQLRATLSLNESSVRTLEHVTLRAAHEKEATFKLGSRYPIVNASFAPIFNNAAISQVIGNQSFTAPFPSFSYEDLGLTLKAKPSVHGTSDVSLQLELLFRTLGGVSLNGVPVISNREYKAGIALKEGEPAVVAGMVTSTEQKSLSGLPGLSRVPGLKNLAAENSKQEEDDELLIVITPFVVRGPDVRETPEIWLSK
jgi:type II secretory pathway component GspD/PulD (secretin)